MDEGPESRLPLPAPSRDGGCRSRHKSALLPQPQSVQLSQTMSPARAEVAVERDGGPPTQGTGSRPTSLSQHHGDSMFKIQVAEIESGELLAAHPVSMKSHRMATSRRESKSGCSEAARKLARRFTAPVQTSDGRRGLVLRLEMPTSADAIHRAT